MHAQLHGIVIVHWIAFYLCSHFGTIYVSEIVKEVPIFFFRGISTLSAYSFLRRVKRGCDRVGILWKSIMVTPKIVL